MSRLGLHPGRIVVVVPAFNEENVITEVLRDLAAFPSRIVVVDDGSSDKTADLAVQAGALVLRHPCNLGQGAALQTGIDFAVARPETEVIVTFDGDGQHAAQDLPRLVAPVCEQGYDVTLGSRFLPGSSLVGASTSRRLTLRLATVFTRVTSGLALSDAHNGLRAFDVRAAARVRITQNGMAHASEILFQIARLGLRYCEVPATVRYTPYSLGKGQRMANSLNILWDLVSGTMK